MSSKDNLLFDHQPPSLMQLYGFIPNHLQQHSGTDIQQSNPWIVSTDFTDWLSRIPEDIYNQPNTFHPNHMEIPNHSLPVEELVKIEGQSHNEMYCRPSEMLTQNMQEQPQQQTNHSDGRPIMASFPPESLQDFKHVLYNLLVEQFNTQSGSAFVQPCSFDEEGVVRHGFRFNSRQNPEKKLPELYAQHIRKARLDCEDQNSVFIQDLYKYYLRACVELLSKYFEKRDKYTYLYDDIPLFVPGETLDQAEERIKTMKTRARKKRKLLSGK